MQKVWWSQAWPYLLLSTIWMILAILVNPQGEFPLNDDWSYYQAVYHLSEEGRLQFNNWQAMSLIAQVFWGTLFCKVFGFSFTVLRLSTLLLSLIGLCSVFALLRKYSSTSLAFVACLTLAANPFWFAMSYTFMTDIPFLSTVLGAVYFYEKSFTTKGNKALWIATFLVILATLIRQIGLLIPLVYGVAFWYKSGFSLRGLLRAFVPMGVTATVLYGTLFIMKKAELLSPDYMGAGQLFGGMSLHEMHLRPGMIAYYCGLFLLPITLLILPANWKKATTRIRWQSLALAALGALSFIPAWAKIPWGNVWYNFGIGQKIFKDTYWGQNFRPKISGLPLDSIRLIGFLGAFLLCLLLAIFLLEKWKEHKNPLRWKIAPLTLYSGLMILAYGAFLLAHPLFIDRYTMPLVPFLLFFLCADSSVRIPNLSWLLSGITLLFLLAFSATGTSDYLSWNRARWEATAYLEAQGISPHQIDGGFEYNGWHLTGPDGRPEKYDEKSWWFVDDDEYVIGFGQICGYQKQKAFAFPQLLPMRTDSLYILQRHSSEQVANYVCDLEERSADEKYFLSQEGRPFSGGAQRSQRYAHSGKHSMVFHKGSAYGLQNRLTQVRACEELDLSVWRYPQGSKLGIVCSTPEAKIFYNFEAKKIVEQDSMGWEKLRSRIYLPYHFKESELEIYLWSQSPDSVWVDDFQLIRIR